MTRFGVGTLNIRAKAARKHPDRLYADLVAALELYDVVCLQEAGPPASKAVVRRLVDNGHAIAYQGDRGKGSAGVTILWRPGLDVRNSDSTQLTPQNLRIGPGAGPDTIPAKWLNEITLLVAGRWITVMDVHGIASAYLPLRKRWARRLFDGVVDHVDDTPGAVILCGDLNRPAGHKMLRRTLYRALTSTQLLLGRVRTHRRVAKGIDDILFRQPPRAKRVVLTVAVRPGPHKTVSDHLLYGVLFDVTPGPH